MILDGQQRIQSLLLALCGDSWGFTLPDKDWKRHLEGKDECINPAYWSAGSLCLNLATFMKEYQRCNNRIASIEIGKCVNWVVVDEATGISTQSKSHVLPLFSNGNFIRFSKLWDNARPATSLMPDDYVPILYHVNSSLKDAAKSQYIKPLSEFMTIIADVKDSTIITRLIVKDFDSSGIRDKSLYNTAIVNIFARLN